MELKTVRIEKPEDINFILGQSHFIKTVEDIYETMVGAMPGAKFGVAFCEASGPCLVRFAGTDAAMIDLAKKNALALSAGHSFIIFMTGMFPVNVLNAIKNDTIIIIATHDHQNITSLCDQILEMKEGNLYDKN